MSNARGIEVDPDSLRRVVTALKAEADGKALKRDLFKGLREVATPARDAARSAIMAMRVTGRQRREPGLRASIAARTTVTIRGSGKNPGVAVRVGRKGMPRGFGLAGRAINRGEWRHPTFGNRAKWVVQRGDQGWFDGTMSKFRPDAREKAKRALDAVAERISRSTKG